MKTKHLDNEIERLNLMERTEDLSEYGQDMLNEFRAIKQALTIPVVSNRRELLNALADEFNDSTHTYVGQPLIEKILKAFNCG
jgi:hypothetical protein